MGCQEGGGLVFKSSAGVAVVAVRGVGIGGIHVPIAGHPPGTVPCRRLSGDDGIFLDTLCLPHGDPPDVAATAWIRGHSVVCRYLRSCL